MTLHLPDGEQMSIFDASERYAETGSRSSFSPDTSTDPAHRATGPRRARTCSGSAR